MDEAFAKIICQEITKLDLELKNYIKNINDGLEDKETLRNVNSKAYDISYKIKTRIEDLDDLEDKHLEKEIKLLKEQYQKNIKDLRSATLKAQLRFDLMSHSSLIKDQPEYLRKRNQAKRNETLAKSIELTTNMKDVTRFIAQTVKHSEDNLNLLTESSSKIGSTHNELQDMDVNLIQSRKLLNKYDKRHLTDKLLIALALTFFFCAVLYIIMKRVRLLGLLKLGTADVKYGVGKNN